MLISTTACAAQVYTNIRKFKEDLSLYPPHHFVCVPLVLDTLYGRVSPSHPISLIQAVRGFQSATCCLVCAACMSGQGLLEFRIVRDSPDERVLWEVAE